MSWLRFGGAAAAQAPGMDELWRRRRRAVTRAAEYMFDAWEHFLMRPTVCTSVGTGGGIRKLLRRAELRDLIPRWLVADGAEEPERLRRYRLEHVGLDLILKVEETAAPQTRWALTLKPPPPQPPRTSALQTAAASRWRLGLHRDMTRGQVGAKGGGGQWVERASFSFALGQWWLTPNVFSRTGDAVVIPTALAALTPDTRPTGTPRRRPAKPPRPEEKSVRAWMASRGFGRESADLTALLLLLRTRARDRLFFIKLCGASAAEYSSHVVRAFRAAAYPATQWVSELEAMSPGELRQLVAAIDRTSPTEAHLELCVCLYAPGLSETWRCQFKTPELIGAPRWHTPFRSALALERAGGAHRSGGAEGGGPARLRSSSLGRRGDNQRRHIRHAAARPHRLGAAAAE
eukprot:SAG11_NODE_3273_length_2561_cov_1.925670_2_plen_404_part_00